VSRDQRRSVTVPTRRSSKARSGLDRLNRRWHLAHDTHEIELTEFEYAAIRMNAAFERWNVAAIRAAGGEPLTFTEASILHVIRMQERPKSISLIANLLNRDDIPNLQYGLRKLRSLELIRPTGARSRKTYEYEVTPRGRELTERVGEIAESLLFSSTRELGDVEGKLRAAANLLRIMTGILDESARVAGTFLSAEAVPPVRATRRAANGRDRRR
jgi:predicted MarR family transcription regulator